MRTEPLVAVAAEHRPGARAAAPVAPRRWALPHYLAVAGVPVLIWNAWTIIAWLLDGPEAVTEFRDSGSVSWYAARVIECAVVVASLVMIGYLVRGCRRAGRVLTFDVMYCLVGATIFWSDFGMNFFQPVFVASSNFVNVNNPCGHMPFIVNSECGRGPEPILFFPLVETFLVLALAIGISKLVSRARRRWPGMSTAQLFGVILAIATAFSLAEILILALGVWGYAGPRWMSFSPGHGVHYSAVVLLGTALFFGPMAALYIIRNDKGQTIVERGLEHHPPALRKAITLMALYTSVQFITWIPGDGPMILASFYQDGWSKMPAHLVNGTCDAPGIEGTRYGPCPGSPGYRMPGRHSLP